MAETVIELKNIAKKYCFSLAKQSLLNNVLSFFKKALPKTDVWALKDINFSVEKGQILGIIGENASGKTTILRIISRITVPTLGQVMVKGKVAGLLDLGAGFHPELTGRENIYLDAALYGLNKTQTDALLLEIIEFSGLEDLVDAQVKTYSQGMLVRLGFSVAVHVDPDIFLIDDSLAVGDEEFQRKCLSKILELKEHGKTIIVVSHDLDSISRICERGILLKSGRIVKDDSMHKVIIRYVEAVGDKDSIVAIDKGKLSVIFNGGRIILLWNGKPLTKNFGGYISVQVMDKWILSWKARWKVIEKSADYFKVQGSWDNYGLNICIEVYLNNECSISWKSIIEGSGNADAREIIIGLMLDGIYNHYFDNYRMKQIEKRHYKSSRWYDIYRTDEQNAALILKTDDELPAVVISFKKNNIEGFQLIQKTDSNLDASVAQIHMILSESMKRNDSRIQTVYCEADIEVAQEERIEQIIIKQRRKKSIEQGLLRLELEGKSLHVFFDDRRLTGRKGLQFGFSYQEKYFNIFDEEWNFEKKDAQSMSISSWLKDNKIKTKLNIIMENNKICWQFDVKEDKSVAVGIESVEVNLFAVEKYENYFSLEESGHFSNVIGFNNKTEIRNSLEAVIGLRGEDPNLPWLISEYGINTKVQLFDMQKEAGGRLIRAWVKESNSIKGSIFVFKEKKNIDNYLLEQRKNLQKSKVLSNDILMLSFSDNRIRLFWKGIEVTAENGLSSSIFFNGCWYESEINDKQIVKNGNKLDILIKHSSLPIEQRWEIALNNNEIEWTIEITTQGPIAEFYYQAGIFLKKQFSQWRNLYEKGYFTSAGEKSRISVGLSNKLSPLLGVCAENNNFPGLIFKRIDLNNKSLALIEGFENERLLRFQCAVSPKEIGGSLIKKDIFKGKLCFIQKKQWEEQIVEYCRENFELSAGNDFLLKFTNKAINLIYKDKRINAETGFLVAISNKEKLFDSSLAEWYAEKLSPDKIMVTLEWEDAPFKQRWIFSAHNNQINWKIILDAKEEVVLNEVDLCVLMPLDYRNWISEQAQGSFDLNPQDSQYQDVNLIDNRSRFIIIHKGSLSPENPGLALAPDINMNDWMLHIYIMNNRNAVSFGCTSLISDKGLILKAGETEFFSAEIMLTEQKTINKVHNVKNNKINKAELVSGQTVIRLEKAKIDLWVKGKKITNALCLYTAFRVFDKWTDSTQAKWKLNKHDLKIQADLSWNRLAVKQSWQISIVNEHEIEWLVNADLKNTTITDMAAVLMVEPGYDCWKTASNEEGRFPENYGLWKTLAESGKPISVFEEKHKLPDLYFEGFFKNNKFSNVIENTDTAYKSRVLKCVCNISENERGKQKQLSFKGKIRIGN